MNEREELNRCFIYARLLAKHLNHKHYKVNSFQTEPTLYRVLNQIDNMTCGLVRKDKE